MKINRPDVRPAFPFTNDPGMARRHAELQAFRQGVNDAERRVAVIVGTGGLLSLTDVMPRTVYVTDYSDELLSWVMRSVGTMLKEPNPLKFMRGMQIDRDDLGEGEQKSFGNLHFLKNKDRYERCRAALRGIDMHYMQIDYSQSDEVALLGSVLRTRRQVIDTFNPTNMHEHIPKSDRTDYARGLESLPWADTHKIICSQLGVDSSFVPALDRLGDYVQFTGVPESDAA